MGSPEQKLKAGEALESASGFIRRLIGDRLRLRVTPVVTFKLDNSVDYSIQIAEKIERVKDELKKAAADKENNNFLISSHINPEADAIGSELGFCIF